MTINDEEEDENEGTSRNQTSRERTSREVTLFDANSRQFGGSYRFSYNNQDGGINSDQSMGQGNLQLDLSQELADVSFKIEQEQQSLKSDRKNNNPAAISTNDELVIV